MKPHATPSRRPSPLIGIVGLLGYVIAAALVAGAVVLAFVLLFAMQPPR